MSLPGRRCLKCLSPRWLGRQAWGSGDVEGISTAARSAPPLSGSSPAAPAGVDLIMYDDARRDAERISKINDKYVPSFLYAKQVSNTYSSRCEHVRLTVIDRMDN
eukprot:6211316-Pleurochrysis_carterae.AAC.3